MTRLLSLLFACALGAAPACIIVPDSDTPASRPPPQPQPAPQPQPTPQPQPQPQPQPAPSPQPAPQQPPPSARCQLSGAPLYRASTARGGAASRNIIIYESGGWQIDTPELRAAGCLDDSATQAIAAAAAAADFTPPPPPRMQCRAVPIFETRVESAGKLARFTHPCGTPVSAGVVELQRLVDQTLEAPSLPAPAPQASCTADGPLLVEHRVLPMPRGSRDLRLQLRITGAWQRLDDKRQTASGCLSSEQLARLQAAVAAADLRPPPRAEITCMALPNQHDILTTAKGSIGFDSPCGKQAPSDSARLLIELARELAK